MGISGAMLVSGSVELSKVLECLDMLEFMEISLPETNKSPLKIGGWKMIHFLLGFDSFPGASAVSFREGMESESSSKQSLNVWNCYFF